MDESTLTVYVLTCESPEHIVDDPSLGEYADHGEALLVCRLHQRLHPGHTVTITGKELLP